MDDSEATADMEGGAAYQDALEQQQVYMPVVPAPGVSGSAPASTREEEADTEYDEMATESDDEGKAAVAAQGGPMPTRKPAPNRRSAMQQPGAVYAGTIAASAACTSNDRLFDGWQPLSRVGFLRWPGWDGE